MVKSIDRRKARKRHICKACDLYIEAGEIYVSAIVLNEETCRHETLRYHNSCYDNRNDDKDEFISDELRKDDAEAMRMQWDREFQ